MSDNSSSFETRNGHNAVIPNNDDALFVRLKDIRPRLSGHIRILPQTYRGVRWFVLANESRGNFIRFNQRAYAAIGRFDGRLTLADILNTVNRSKTILTQKEIAYLVIQLANFEALHDPLPDDVAALTFNRGQGLNRSIVNPLALRFPLFDPDRFLDVALPFVRPLFSTFTLVIWAAMIIFAIILGITHISELTAPINSSLLNPINIILGMVVFVVIKTFHEFAHAFAVKMWGGEVHEMGISLLVLMPVPYVDASSSWAFRNRYRRALVGAMGIMTELFIAAVALIVFIGVEPGFVRSIALNAMLIGSFSTLLVNGNPLLRFDGYYVLQDILELPNLSSRSSRYLIYLVQRYILKIDSARSPVTGPGEKPWLLIYGVLAGVYRVLILCVIGLFLASKYLVAGVALMTWAVVMQVVLPVLKGVWFIFTSPLLSDHRKQAIFRGAAIPTLVFLVLAFVPFNQTTTSQGVVWVPDQAQLYANSEGLVSELLIPHGQIVAEGTPLLTLHNPDLQLRRNVVEAKRVELETRRRSVQFSDRNAAEAAEQELSSVRAELVMLDAQLEALTIVSPVNGTLVYAKPNAFEGSYVRQGNLVAYVVDPKSYIVRSVVTQADIGRLRSGVRSVEIRLAENLGHAVPAAILRETPAGTHQLPGGALSHGGGGPIETLMHDEGGMRSTTEVFNIDLALPQKTTARGIGSRAYVRYEHDPLPLLKQWKQRLQQLLLRRLAI